MDTENPGPSVDRAKSMSTSTAPAGDSDTGERRQKIRSAIADWKKQLLDLSGRNALLYFKEYKLSTLDLSQAAPLDSTDYSPASGSR
jgi:hypothetical protein